MGKRENYHNMTTGDIAKIKELFASGVSRASIAKQIGCAASTVTYYLEEAGIPKGQNKKLTLEDVEKIKELSKQHLPQDEIANIVGCSKITVRRYQQIAHLPASNRSVPSGQYTKNDPKWHMVDGDEEVKMVKFDPSKIKAASDKPSTPNTKSGEWISVDDASIKISGKKTSFTYSISLLSGDILINTGYGADIPIDSRDLVAFGNELLDMADKIENIKKTFAV